MLRGPFIIFLLFLSALTAQAQNPVVQFVLTSWSISEGIGTYGVAIDIINPNANPTSVDINVLPGGTAAHGVNFTYSPVTVTFQANSQTDQIVTITIIDDSIQDADKYFTFKLANATNNATIGPDSELVFTMINDDTVKFNLPSPLTVPKTAGVITFPVDLDPIKSDSAVHARVRVGASTTAVQGVDYQFNDTIISWPAFTRGTIQVPVTILNDTLIEPNKKVVFTLTDSVTGIPLTDSVFTLTILEDDSGPPAVLQFLQTSDTVANPAVFNLQYFVPIGTVQVNNPGDSSIYFEVIPGNGPFTAIEGNGPPADYRYSDTGRYAPPGISTFTIYINPIANPEISATKSMVFRIHVINGNGIMGQDSLDTVYITNNNKLIVSFLGAGFSYPKDTALVMVPVVMSTFPHVPISVDVSLAPGSAILGQDFLFDDTTVIFPAYSQDTQGVWVHIINNSVYEANKQINFNLSNPSGNAILGITGYTLTIINNDSLAGIGSPGASPNFDIFPDPVIDQLIIQCSSASEKLEIFDMLGNKLITTNTSGSDHFSMNLSNLPSGVYIAALLTNNKIIYRRFIKAASLR